MRDAGCSPSWGIRGLRRLCPALWGRLVEVGVLNNASDIHLTYQSDGLHVALRIDGQLVEQGRIESLELAHRVSNHVKIVGALDLGERRRPQSGRAMAKVADRAVDLRISALPTIHGQDLVVRILDRTVSLLDVEQLGLRRRERNRMFGLTSVPSGLVLVSGPTGAGKTTTLYAILRKLNDGTRKIITIENPTEYDLPGINQSQVHAKLGLGFHGLLQTVLQQDPDVIMIGEVRDVETASTAVRAAVTGHVVFATTHAIRAAEAVESMISLGAHPHFLGGALRGVIAQNLVRAVCPQCAERIDETAALLPLDDVSQLLEADQTPSLAIGRGCDHCFGTGYRGRVGLFEILVTDAEIRHLIENRRPADEIHRAAVNGGMVTLQQSGKLAAFLGQTTVEELVRVIPMSTDDPVDRPVAEVQPV